MSVDLERNSKDFSPIDKHYLEISKLLLTHAKGDIPEKTRVRTLIEDLYTLRSSKIRVGMRDLRAEDSGIKLNNISDMELQNIRGILVQAITTIHEIKGYSTN
jgi:hypothetical protein